MSDLTLFEETAPPLIRPTMREIAALRRNGLKAVGSFSGAGGSSLGLKWAGWEILAAVEFIPEAATTYRANFPEVQLFQKDIRELKIGEVLDAIGMVSGELDMFEGSPPCASFSAAGAGEKSRERTCPDCGGSGTPVVELGEEVPEDAPPCETCDGRGLLVPGMKKYSDAAQRTDDLFFEWVRLLEGMMPRALIAENVPGMIRGSGTEYAHRVTQLLGKLGYRVFAKVLLASNYGTPQNRRRLIFVGFREDVAARYVERTGRALWEWPAPTTPVPHTVRQALATVDPSDPDHSPEFIAESSMEPYAVGRTWHALKERGARRAGHGDRNAIPPLEDHCGRCGKLLDEHDVTKRDNKNRVLAATCADGEKAVITKDYFTFYLGEMDKPSYVLTATGSEPGAASVTHPEECRKYTPAEAKALCGFPPDFVLTGTRQQRYERMGRAVPPPLYEVLGRAIAARLS